MQFSQLNLIAPLLGAVREAGYVTPSPIQQKTIPLVLAGRDVLGCAQTGTGKTAAFALPILQRLNKGEPARPGAPRALILTPTRELAIQIQENFVQYGSKLKLKSAVIFGGVNQNPQVETLKKGVDILIATPGRLNDLIGQGFISLSSLTVFVLDEADRMLDMGFIHDVKKVIKLLPEKRQTLLFSATMPPEVEELALGLLRDPATVKISPVTKTVDKIAQSVYFIQKADKPAALLWLLEQYPGEAALVFTRTKHGANQVAAKLTKAGVQALAIHGNKSQNARQEALGSFKAGTLRVLVATDIAARGIDVAELPLVINYNVPDTPEAYIHRIGRTGRAGAEGIALSMCESDELKDWWDIEKHTGQSVPVGECPWSVTDMQPTDRPAPGSNRQPRAKAEEAPKQEQPKKAEKPRQEQPKKAEKPKQEQPKKAEKPKQEQPKKAEKPKQEQPIKAEKPRQEQPKKAEKPKQEQPKKAEKTKEQPRPEPRPEPKPEPELPPLPAQPRRSSYGAAYAARYGTRPVRPFQSRASLEPKAEDNPPPPPTEMRTRFGSWSEEYVLPERRPILTGDLPKPEEEAPAPGETAAGPTENAPAKKRRHRGGRRHKKSDT